MTHPSHRPWHLYVLALITAGVVAFAITQIGPPTSSARTSTEVVTAANGVVQSTVSGTGNVQAGSDVDANFQSSGTLASINVSVGQHVFKGQLLARLDPTAAQLTVSQAQASLTAAQDQLTAVENGTSTSGGSATSASTTVAPTTAEFVSTSTTTSGSGRTPTTSTPSPTRTAPTTTAPSSGGSTKPRAPSTGTSRSSPPANGSAGTSNTSANASGGGSSSNRSGAQSGSGASTSSTSTTTTTTPSPSSIASAQASIDTAESNLRTAEENLTKMSLFAPASGTIVSLASLSPGDDVSAGSSGAANTSSSSSSSGSGGGNTGGGASTAAGGLGGGAGSSSSSASSSGGSSSSTPFAEIVDTSTMTMTVAFSESDITKVKVGQPATVSIDALSGVELAGHVSAISTVGTSSSGVVSYNATITLDQLDSRVKPGMSASATVITGQAQGVTVPTQALSGSGSLATVSAKRGGKTVQQQVVVGLRGSTRAQIVSGLNSGDQVVITISLPALGTSTSSPSGGTGTLGGGGGLGGGGLRGLGGGGFPGGGGGFFRGGGG